MKLSQLIHDKAPIPEQVAIDLFAFVHDACGEDGNGCHCGGDDGWFHTREFCRAHGLDADEIIDWLEGEFGAYCDCSAQDSAAIWYLPSDFDPEVDNYGNEIEIEQELSSQEKQVLYDNYRASREEQRHGRRTQQHASIGTGWLFERVR